MFLHKKGIYLAKSSTFFFRLYFFLYLLGAPRFSNKTWLFHVPCSNKDELITQYIILHYQFKRESSGSLIYCFAGLLSCFCWPTYSELSTLLEYSNFNLLQFPPHVRGPHFLLYLSSLNLKTAFAWFSLISRLANSVSSPGIMVSTFGSISAFLSRETPAIHLEVLAIHLDLHTEA